MRAITFGLSAALLAAGCGKETAKPAADPASGGRQPPGSAATDPAVATFLLASAPAGKVREVKDVRDNGKDGEEVVIAGRVQDFVEDRAMFDLVDNSLKPCNEKPGDECKTPWDYCCDLDVLPKMKVVVKLADDKGQVVKAPLKGPLHLLDRVLVTGKVAKSAEGNVAILAAGVFNKGGGVK